MIALPMAPPPIVAEARPVIEIDEAHYFELPEGYDPDKTLFTSSSQFSTFEDCERKWWLTWPMKVVQPLKDYFAFGTALHACNERYLQADDLDRDPKTGKAVDLFPKGWDEGLDGIQSELIRNLVKKGIAEGLLVRHPDRAIEHRFVKELIRFDDGWVVLLVGFIDYLLWRLGQVQDHKTTKDMRYAKSPAQLKDDTQMLTYADEAFEVAAQHGIHHETITVRHNVYLKDPSKLKIKKSEAVVTRAQVDARRERMRDMAKRMVLLKQRYAKPEQWGQLPNPKSFEACNKYGGCAFRLICGGRKTVKEYTHQTTKSNEAKSAKGAPVETIKEIPVTTATAPKTPFQNLLGAAKANGAGAAKGINGPTPTPTPAAPPTGKEFWVVITGQKQATDCPTPGHVAALLSEHGVAALDFQACEKGVKTWSTLRALGFVVADVAQAEAAPEVPSEAPPVGKTPPPWADPACTACEGEGWNSKKNACRICAGTAKAAGRPTPDQFDTGVDEAGNPVWSDKAEAAPAPVAPPPAPKPPKVKAPTPTPPVPAPVAAPAPTPPPAAEGETPSKGGRPTTSFTLIIGGMVCGKSVADLTEIMAEKGAELAAKAGVGSYYEFQPFERRDALCSLAPSIAEAHKGKWIVANGTSPDLVALRDALRGLASVVVEGV